MGQENKKEPLEKIYWKDCKEWWKIYDITVSKMLSKFYPHFVGHEEDIRQELMIALIAGIRRIKRGEIRSPKNYLITHMKYAAYKLAKDKITYDKTFIYLEDMGIRDKSGKKWSKLLEWNDLFDMGYFSYETILSCIDSFEERYMILNIMEVPGYTKRKLRALVKKDWPYIDALEVRVKEKLAEIIKMHSANKGAY